MGIQDRDYYHEHLAEQAKATSARDRPNPYAQALRRAEQRRRVSSSGEGRWDRWFAVVCLVVFVLIACAAVWMGRR